MADTFSLSEIFRMAEEIERNGVKFYTEAAGNASDKVTKEVMLKLAGAEKQHEELFGGLRKQYCGVNDLHIVDQDGTVEAYIRAIADTHVFNMDKTVSELLSSVQSPESALQMAIGFEKDTIVFFTTLKNAVNDENKKKVDKLIKEEVQHIISLQDALAKLDK